MAKDWITGRSWNTGGGGGSPFAMAAIGLLSALQNNRKEDERKEEMERMEQERKAMKEIEYGRSRLDKIMTLDPSLIMDPDFNTFYKTGDFPGAGQYLKGKGWAPLPEAEKLSLTEQLDNQVIEWQQKDPSGATWPVSVKNYATFKHKMFPETRETTWKTQITDYGSGKRLTRFNDDGGMQVWNGNGWENAVTLPGKPPSPGGGGGGGGKEKDKEPKPLSRADLDSISRAVLGGRDVFGGMTQGLVNMLDTPEKLDEALVQTYGEIPAALDYARKQAFRNPASKKFYGKTPGAVVANPPPPPPPGGIDKAKLNKMASDAVAKLGISGALAQVEGAKLTAEEKAYLRSRIQAQPKQNATVPVIPNVHL